MKLQVPTRVFEFPRPWVMGILNVNDDSFSGDGSLAADDAIATARAQVAAVRCMPATSSRPSGP